ncbi:MAG TPA: cytochrome c oxidase subunit 4 [Acidimicrobiales bacterium]|nr:cytochrome c oxidase subunit 4 [Acidimicrobiales bacterium]
MKTEAKLLIFLGLSFLILGIIYWLWSGENAGGMMLIASAGLGFLPGGYYLWWSNRMRERASDRTDATVADGAGVIETFPGSSIWPFTLGMGAFCVGLALAFGNWFALPAAGLTVWALLGAVVESRRGDPGSAAPHH